jgi:putative FmdB family regulatory protein
MPRYAYHCSECDKEVTLFHLVAEEAPPCPLCNSVEHLAKLLSAFATKRKQKQKQKIGDTTEKFIETAGAELKQQKKDLKDKR